MEYNSKNVYDDFNPVSGTWIKYRGFCLYFTFCTIKLTIVAIYKVFPSFSPPQRKDIPVDID